ncbi:MAG: hypothetical protein ACP5ID_04320 [Conexivisphaera sp.]
MDLSPRDVLLLDSLQYSMEPGPEPFDAAAESLGVDAELLVRDARRLREGGAIRRIGVSLNSRALGGASALVVAAVPPERALEYARAISSRGRSKHSYVRSFPGYNLWFTYRAPDPDALLREVGSLMSSMGVRDWIVLATARAFKLSVKYDLERGVSWSPPAVIRPDPPTLGDLGIDRSIVRRLEDLPISRRPLREAAADVGETEEGLADVLEELLSRGVAVDFGAVLEPEAVGIRHNAVIMGEGGEAECEAIARWAPEATHVILREPLGAEWRMRAYLVVHARRREDVEAAAARAAELSGLGEMAVAYGEGGFTV